jgi:hypothetical protein
MLFMERNYKHWWSTIPQISTKWTTTSHLKSLNTKKTTTYDVGNPWSQSNHDINVHSTNKLSNTDIFVPVPNQSLDFQHHMSSSFLCSKIWLLEETRVPGENQSTRRKPPTCLPQVTNKLYHIMLYTSPWAGFEPTTSGGDTQVLHR